jgi:hypothetical protein
MRTRSLLTVLLALAGSVTAAETHLYQRQGQVVEIQLHPDLPQSQRPQVLGWVHASADALASVFGRWPRDRWRVRVTPLATRHDDPVPWAQVNRGDPDLVSFYIDASADQQRLLNNWTAYHEFSHLLIPYRGWGDLWFSEGLASYYQNLLQARRGVIDERGLWQRLHNGFERGRRNRRPDLSLAQLSDVMRENHSYMRVYWSGAWYFLTADLALRHLSQGRQSLDTALGALNACCAELNLSARDIARRLDELSGQAVFLPLFDEVSSSRQMPEFAGHFASLGIRLQDGVVILEEDHPWAPLRRQFVSPGS